MGKTPITAIVLAGAVARGAYEAGALSAVLSSGQAGLASLGSTFLLGTSSGAINAALWAKHATPGTPLAKVGGLVEHTWLSIKPGDVFREPLDPRNAIPAVKALLGLKGVDGLLDTSPLLRTVKARMRPRNDIAKNIRAGSVQGVGAVATYYPGDASSGRTRIFWESKIKPPQGAAAGAIDFIPTEIEPQHIVASSAVPALFPARHVTTAPAEGWYVDGGVRMNTPLKPAIDLGADQIIVVSSFAAEYPPALSGPPPKRRKPNVAEAAALSLHAVLGDGLIEDLVRLRHINAALQNPRAPNPKGHRIIRHLVVSPDNGVLSELARKNFRSTPLYWGIDEMLMHNNELLSYLYFDPGYFNAQIVQARADAAKASWRV